MQITKFGTYFNYFGTLDSALGLRPIKLEFHHTKIRLALRLVTFVLSFLTGVYQLFGIRGAPTNKIEEKLPYFEE